MKKSVKKVALLFVVTLYFIGIQHITAQNTKRDIVTIKIIELLQHIDKNYIDTLDFGKFSDEISRQIISLLDPHSSYISAKEVKEANEPLVGSFDGIGIEFSIIRDTLNVVATIVGGPSEKVGLLAGDKIVAVDDHTIASINLSNRDVYNYLRGPRGSKVALKVKRKGVLESLSFTITRDKIPIHSVDAAYTLSNEVAYIKLSRFAATSAHEIIEALLDLDMPQIRGIVLDLRGNSGGYLGSALEIANFFLEKGETILSIEGRSMPKISEKAKGNGFFKKGALAIVVDEYSASASEIVAGAVQDWDRGAIFGRRTFGKGLVQQPFTLKDSSQVRLTVAQYLTPSGRAIQTPFKIGESGEYYKQMGERYRRGELFNRDSLLINDSLKYTTLKEGRTVYGGGGIVPDFFIAADTSFYSNYYGRLIREGVFQSFVNDYSYGYRDSLLSIYPKSELFANSFSIQSNNLMESLFEYATKEGIEYRSEEALKSFDYLQILLKAHIARSLYGNSAYYQLIEKLDKELFDQLRLYFKREITE